MPAQSPPANIDMSMKLMTEPPWSEPPMFIWSSVGNIRQMPLPGPSGLNSSRPVAAANEPRGKSPQLYHPRFSGSGVAPHGRPTSSIISLLASVTFRILSRDAFGDHLLCLGDCLRRVETLRADVRAVHDGVAAIETERIFELVEPLAGRFIAAVGKPAISLKQDRGPQEAVAVPPIAGAARRSAEAENALIEAVELRTVLGCLQPLARRRRADG